MEEMTQYRHNGGNMATAKEHITEIIKRQPDDSSYDDIVRELAFDLMVQRGLKDSDEQRVISNKEMERRIKTWQK
jgi:hypothetical protein